MSILVGFSIDYSFIRNWMVHDLLLLSFIYSNASQAATQKENQKLAFKTDYRLMQVQSFEECSKEIILQYF